MPTTAPLLPLRPPRHARALPGVRAERKPPRPEFGRGGCISGGFRTRGLDRAAAPTLEAHAAEQGETGDGNTGERHGGRRGWIEVRRELKGQQALQRGNAWPATCAP